MNQSPFYNSVIFNGFFVGLSVILFCAVLVTFVLRMSAYQSLSRTQRRPYNAALLVALTNLLYMLLFTVRQLFSDQQTLQQGSATIDYSVLFPVATLLAVIYYGYSAFEVWRLSLLSSASYRWCYSLLGLSGLFMLWFYYYWQLWGFSYYF